MFCLLWHSLYNIVGSFYNAQAFYSEDYIFLKTCIFRRMKLAEFDYGKKCSDIAKLCIGLSGREISKLGVAWQVSCSRLEDISCLSTKTTFLWCSWEAFH